MRWSGSTCVWLVPSFRDCRANGRTKAEVLSVILDWESFGVERELTCRARDMMTVQGRRSLQCLVLGLK